MAVRDRFILPPDLGDDPAFALDSYNWSTFERWEFDLRRCAGYLGNVDFFIQERYARFDEEVEDMEEEEEDELQPTNLTEDKAMEMAIAKSELDDLGQWGGLAVQLRASMPQCLSSHPPREATDPSASSSGAIVILGYYVAFFYLFLALCKCLYYK
jgi:hypothetical protein